MIRCKKNHLKLNKKQYQFLRHLCRASKDLFNATLYATRQHYFQCGEFLDYIKAYKHLMNTEVYHGLPSDPAQQTMKVVERCFRSFFGLIQKKKSGNYNRPVKMPHYLPKDGYFPIFLPTRPGRMQEAFSILVPKHLQKRFGFGKLTIERPEYTKGKKLKEVRILPKLEGGYFEIEWVYEDEEQPQQLDPARTLGIDVGVDNFATCVDSQSGRSFILDGRQLKSYNRYVNKQVAAKQAVHDKLGLKTSKNKKRLFLKRKNILNNALNQYVNVIVNYCLENKVGNVVIGQGYFAQEGCNHGNVNNQNFVMLPYGLFCQKLKSKCELYGITYESREESYTSKCDHLAGEEMKHHDEYLGRRVKRGLFRSSTGVFLNADVNGALGIILKSKREVDLGQLASSGCLTQPSRIRLGEIQAGSAKNVLVARGLTSGRSIKPQGKPCGM